MSLWCCFTLTQLLFYWGFRAEFPAGTRYLLCLSLPVPLLIVLLLQAHRNWDSLCSREIMAVSACGLEPPLALGPRESHCSDCRSEWQGTWIWGSCRDSLRCCTGWEPCHTIHLFRPKCLLIGVKVSWWGRAPALGKDSWGPGIRKALGCRGWYWRWQ